MSIITLPTDLYVGQFEWGQLTSDMAETSETSGAMAARVLGPARWLCSMGGGNDMTLLQAGVWEALIAALKGRVNHLELYDLRRPAPQGTIRGSLTLSSTAAAGASTISVTGGVGQASTTAKRGDLFQLGSGLGSQLVMVTADATANGSGVISLSIQPDLRVQFTSGTVVTWDKPKAYFKRVTNRAVWAAIAGSLNSEGHSLDLVEQWT